MADFTDKVAKAREAGYSDDEIVQFLSSGDMSAKIKKAQEAGYSSGEIVGFLGNAPQAPSGPRDASTALTDPEWAKKGRTLYKESNAQDFQGSDEEAAKWLNNYLYDFNYRLAGVGADNARGTLDTAAQISGYSDEGKKAFVDAQTQFENMNTTLGGMGEAAKRVFTDPTTYIGLGTFGVGTGVAQGAKQVAKKGVVELAKVGAKRAATRGAAIGTAEGATYGAVSDLGQQQAMVNAGGQEAIDPMQTAQVAGLSGLTGGVLGGAVGGASGFIRGRNPTVKAAQQIVADPEVATRGAEITQRMANLQDSVQKLSPETYVGKEQVNANLAPIKGDVKNAIDQLGLDKNTARKLKEGLDKASGISEEDIANLRSMPGGNAVAENIMFLRQANAMTRPIPNDGIVPKLGRFALDKLSPVPIISDPIKSALFPARISGELRVDRMVSPRNRKIAEEILRLQGSSAATRGRQELLDAGLNMARARKLMRDTQKAQEAADRAKRQSDFEAKRSERLNIRDTKQSLRFQENMLKERAKVEKDAQKAQAKAEADNIAQAKQAMGFQWKMEAQKTRETKANIDGAKQEMYFQIRMAQQRAKEELQAKRALDSLEKAQANAKTQEERQFNKSLAGVNRIMRFRRAMERLKAAETKRAPAETISIPPSGMSPGMAPKAPRGRKAAPEGMSQAERKQYASEGGDIRNQQRWEQGMATIQEYENKALEVAKDQPKDVRRALERAIADMRLAKKDQEARYKAYFDAIDAVAPYGPDALEVVDDALYFLVKKYQ